MRMLKEFTRLSEKLWSGEIEAHWKPPEGFFTKSASEIAKGLKSASSDYAEASRRLNFFINRAGKNLSAEDKTRLEAAKKALRIVYGIKESKLREGVGMGFHPNMDYSPINPSTVAAINAVAKQHLSGVEDKESIDTLLGISFIKGYYAGHAQLENQAKKHLAAITTKDAVKSAMDDAYSKGFSAGKSSWQK